MLNSAKNIFTVDQFMFPDSYTFPGKQDNEEVIFATREDKKILTYRRGVVILVALIIVGFGSVLPFEKIRSGLTAIAALELFIGWFCISYLWKRNVVIVTSERIVQFIYKTVLLNESTDLLPNEISGFQIVTDSQLATQFKLQTLIIQSKNKLKKDICVKNIPDAKDLEKFLEKGVE